MINISKSGNAIKFAFTDSDHYLYGNGEIEVPVNSLSLIVDESNMVTFRKANSNDIFLSFDPANSNLSDKAGVINFYKTDMVGSTGGGGGTGSGVTSGEVQTMIDESLDDYYDKDEVDTAFETVNASLSGKADTSYVNAALGDKADTSAVTAVANDVSTLSGQVETKVATTDFSAYSAATDARIAEDEEVTAAALNDLDERIGDPYQKVSGLTIETDEEDLNLPPRIFLEAEGDGQRNENVFDRWGIETYQELEDGSSYSSGLGCGTIYNGATDFPDENVNSERNFEISTDGFRQYTFENYDDGESSYTRYSSENEFNYVNGLTLSQQWYDDENETATNSYINIVNNNGGETYIQLTDTNERTVTIAPNMLSWADGRDNGEIEWSNIATLDDIPEYSAGTGIEISGNVISCTVSGGGATYSAGTNISIDTANTINCTLNLRNGSGDNSIIGTGNGNTASKEATLAFGQSITSSRMYGVSFGLKNVFSESGSQYSFGDSGNTLFSIGNGNRNGGQFHNALDIRQNGDIYFPDTDNTTYANYYEKPMVRLQDMYAALGGLKFVQCTQSEYDALVSGGTVDSSTIYFITNVVS